MVDIRPNVSVTFNVSMTLSENEARALDALVTYGDDSFIKHFKENLGSYYLENHENGLRSFFKGVREEVLPALRKIDTARLGMNEALSPKPKPGTSLVEQHTFKPGG